MLKKRIIPCLDVKDNQVVKGVQFGNHKIVGDIIELAQRYAQQGADELVFYDITASSDQRNINIDWIKNIAQYINIPFCVAGGIRTVAAAAAVLEHGADKISINSPALENPALIESMAKQFGTQCVVVGIDVSNRNGEYIIYQYTGDPTKITSIPKSLLDWAKEAQARGAGELVINCMHQDGMRHGYDCELLNLVTDTVSIPVIASGGAGQMSHFKDVFTKTQVTGALAASVFHNNLINIPDLKTYLKQQDIEVRT